MVLANCVKEKYNDLNNSSRLSSFEGSIGLLHTVLLYGTVELHTRTVGYTVPLLRTPLLHTFAIPSLSVEAIELSDMFFAVVLCGSNVFERLSVRQAWEQQLVDRVGSRQ